MLSSIMEFLGVSGGSKERPEPGGEKARRTGEVEILTATRSGSKDGQGTFSIMSTVDPSTGKVSITLDGQYLTGTVCPDPRALESLPPETAKAALEVVGELESLSAGIADRRIKASVLGELSTYRRSLNRVAHRGTPPRPTTTAARSS